MEITTKELSGIEDILSHYQVCIKKAMYYKSICSNKSVKKLCDDMYKKNINIFNSLVECLK